MSTTITTTPAAAAEIAPAKPNPGNRLGFRWWNRLKAWFGMPWQRRLARAALAVPRVRWWEKQYDRLDDAELKAVGQRLRGRARGGESLDRLVPEAFGLVCVASKRHLGMRPFDVQLAGGVVMHEGGLAELATGEGKTLTATLPAFLNGLEGKGVHVTTVNDYLARRDARLLQPVYEGLGLTVGVHPDADARPGPHRRLPLRHHLRHRQRVRLRLPARPPQGLRRQGAGAPFWAPWMPGGSKRADGQLRAAAAPLRPGRRGRQHLHRRGPHPAHHQQTGPRRHTRKSASSTTGPTRSPCA